MRAPFQLTGLEYLAFPPIRAPFQLTVREYLVVLPRFVPLQFTRFEKRGDDAAAATRPDLPGLEYLGLGERRFLNLLPMDASEYFGVEAA